MLRIEYVISHIYSAHQLKSEAYAQMALDMMKYDYPKTTIKRLQTLKADLSQGICYLNGDNGEEYYEYPCYSGGWGKGHLQTGEYDLFAMSTPRQIKELKNPKPYTKNNFGWFGALEPKFKTERSALGVHPDGNIEFSSGCMVMPFKSIDENIRFYNVIRDSLAHMKSIPLTVRVIYNDRQS